MSLRIDLKKPIAVCVLSSMITVTSPPPVTVRFPAPKTDKVVLPDGTFRETCVVQWQVPAGILTVGSRP